MPLGSRRARSVDACRRGTARPPATIARPRPKEPPRSPAPRTKRSNSVGASSGGTPGPSSSTTSSAPPSGGVARARRGSRVPGGVWRSAFSSRLIARRWSSSRAAAHGRRVDVERDLVVVADGPELAGGLDHDLGEVAAARAGPRARRRCARAAAGRRPAGASAARSAAPSGAASPWSPCSDSASSSRFASTLVSGVRSSCEASATNWRWRASVASVSRARGVELAEHALQRARELGDLVVGLGLGQLREGSRVRAISAAVRGQLGDRRHRAARDRHARRAARARCRRARRAAGTARRAATVASVSATRRPYWTINRPIGSPLGAARRRRPADDAVAVDRLRRRQRRRRASGALAGAVRAISRRRA